MIETQILSQADKYALSLLNHDLIDFDALEFDSSGIIFLPLITSKVPKPNEPFENEDLKMHISDALDFGEMWFTYEPVSHTVESLVIENGCIQQQIFCDSTVYFIGQAKHPEYAQYKLSYDKFIDDIKEKLKEQIRVIMTEVKGEFVKDKFIKDTYFQVRQYNQNDIFYGVNKWWKSLFSGEINFVDVVNGDGTVYIARNN